MKLHPNMPKAMAYYRLIEEAMQGTDPADSESLLVFAKQCSLASQEIERLLNEREPEVVGERKQP